MIKKYILAVIAIALAVWVGFFFGKRSAEAPEAPMSGVTEESATTIPPTGIPVKNVTSTNSAPVAKTTSSPVLTKDGSYLISYTSRGFSPSSITIKRGKSVHFVNNSNKAMSITTTDPNSQLYGEFNQSKTVGQGGIYDFTFTSVGSWGYMNRNNQTDKGVIIVQ